MPPVPHMRRFELREHAVELVLVADVDPLEFEPAGFRDWREVFKIAGIRELVHHAHGVCCVVNDMPCHGRSDKSGAAGDDDAVHTNLKKTFSYVVIIKKASFAISNVQKIVYIAQENIPRN